MIICDGVLSLLQQKTYRELVDFLFRDIGGGAEYLGHHP